MSFSRLLLHSIILGVVVFGTAGSMRAEGVALEELLDVLEDKGILAAEESERIRRAYTLERKRLVAKERRMESMIASLEEREAELDRREKRLEMREKPVLMEKAVLRGEEKPSEPVRPEAGSSHEEKEPAFCLSGLGSEDSILCFNGLLQSDYRYYSYDEGDPDRNRFDIRRARLGLDLRLNGRFRFKALYEFEGAGSRRLLDACLDVRTSPLISFRIGQFKKPFGLEESTRDKDIFFAERSMAHWLGPYRDLGLMAYGSLLTDRVWYGLGIYNGDGLDDTSGGDVDAPEFSGRVAVSLFGGDRPSPAGHLQIGGSYRYARIDRNNVDFEVMTAGLTTFLDVASRAKYRVIQEADSRRAMGLELGWTKGPVALAAEYRNMEYREIATSVESFDVEMDDCYVSLLWMLTGERPVLRGGGVEPIAPKKNLWKDGWGGLGLAVRYDVFEAEESIYDNLVTKGNSVRKARAYTIALNWYLNSSCRLIFDATRTVFDEPLLVDRDSILGTSIYAEREDVYTGRFQFVF